MGDVVEMGLSAIEGKDNPLDKESSMFFHLLLTKSVHSINIESGTVKGSVIVFNFSSPLKFITL